MQACPVLVPRSVNAQSKFVQSVPPGTSHVRSFHHTSHDIQRGHFSLTTRSDKITENWSYLYSIRLTILQNASMKVMPAAEELEDMVSQEPPLLQRANHQEFPGQSSDSDPDSEAAKQLIQQSRGRHEGNGDGVTGPFERTSPAEVYTKTMITDEDQRMAEASFEQHQETVQSISHEHQQDAQYGPINNPPALGQICRYCLLRRTHVSRQPVCLQFD